MDQSLGTSILLTDSFLTGKGVPYQTQVRHPWSELRAVSSAPLGSQGGGFYLWLKHIQMPLFTCEGTYARNCCPQTGWFA